MNTQLLLNEIEEVSCQIESIMMDYVSTQLLEIESLQQKIFYSLSEVGLKIRPFLVKVGYGIRAGDSDEILSVAAAVEFMQIATLVIDDILDESKKRNNRDSVVEKWGSKDAILVGEVLKSTSTILLVRTIEVNKGFKNGNGVISLLEDTYRKISIGQCLDLSFESQEDIGETEYLKMIEKTTAVFLQTPLVIGAMLSGAEENTVNSLSNYGINIGYAYQIRDDVIDIIGEENLTGKPLAGDIKRRKKRLPVIHALENAPTSSRDRIRNVFAKKNVGDQDVLDIIEMLKKNGSIEYSINKTKKFCEIATNELRTIKDSKEKAMLLELATLISSFEN